MKESREFVDILDSPNWAAAEFEQTTVGDRRLDKRLINMATDLAAHPGAPIAQACATKAKIKGAYRFLENDLVEPEYMLTGHRLATIERLKGESVVLAPSETTSFNFSALEQTSGLGPIGTSQDSSQGLWMHSTLAFTLDGLPLGIIAAEFWSRPQEPDPERDPHKIPFEQKESARWLDSWQACQGLVERLDKEGLDKPPMVVNITDTEGDIYEVFEAATKQPAPRAQLLIRSYHDRKLDKEQDSHHQRLYQHLASQPQAATIELKVPRHQEHPSRIAKLEVRYCEALLQAPDSRGEGPALKLWAVEVRESPPAKGVEPILWRLLSTIPVTNADEAIEKVKWYAVRWGIEVFHKIIKSVCRAEDHQLGTAQRLERALGLDLLVSWPIHVLSLVGRQNPDIAASYYFVQSESGRRWRATLTRAGRFRAKRRASAK